MSERHDNSVNNVTHIVLRQWRKCKNISARISRTGVGANTVCLAVELAPNIGEEILEKIWYRWQLLQLIIVSSETRQARNQYPCWS